jgi:polyferredoxin
MKLIEINYRPDRHTLRQFGVIALLAFGLLGALIFWRRAVIGIPLGGATPVVAGVLWAIAGLSGLFSLAAPGLNRFLYVGLVTITWPIGFVLSYLLMGIIFYLVITPVGLIFRLIGRDPLHRRFDRRAGTYWVRHREPENVERYFRQY